MNGHVCAWDPVRVNQCVPKLTSLLLPFPPLIVLPTWSFLQDPMITGQLSKPLLPLRADMDACELRDDDKAASPDSELNDEPLLLSADTDSEEKMYGESQPSSSLILWLTPRGHVRGELNTDECVCLFVSARCCGRKRWNRAGESCGSSVLCLLLVLEWPRITFHYSLDLSLFVTYCFYWM